MWLTIGSSDSNDPKELTETILAIAPILPGQSAWANTDLRPPSSHFNSFVWTPHSPVIAHPASFHSQASGNLIDFDSRPPSTAPPETTAAKKETALPPLLNPQPTAALEQNHTAPAPAGTAAISHNLMDDDHGLSDVNAKMSQMKVHETMVPKGAKPLRRADTENGEMDIFVDAEG